MRVAKMSGALVVACALGLGLAADATAQEPAFPQQAEPIEVTEDLLERFVEVYPAVVNIAQSAQAQLAGAESAEEAQSIQAEAQDRIAATLTEGEITVEEYEAVVMRLNQDEELRAEFEAMLEEAMRDGF